MLTYSTWLAQVADLMAEDPTNADFLTIVPAIIDYAEQRLYRELDLLSTRVTDSSATVTANSRNFTLPSSAGRFVVTEGINIYTPVSTTTTRNPLTPVSLDFLNWSWQTNTAASATTVPQYYAMVTDQTVAFGPPPGAAFTAEVIGTIRPTPLSASNTTTYLTLYLPDLFLAASMIFATAYQRDLGASSDNPAQALSWSAIYDKQFASADAESERQRYGAASWTSKKVEATAVPQRG